MTFLATGHHKNLVLKSAPSRRIMSLATTAEAGVEMTRVLLTHVFADDAEEGIHWEAPSESTLRTRRFRTWRRPGTSPRSRAPCRTAAPRRLWRSCSGNLVLEKRKEKFIKDGGTAEACLPDDSPLKLFVQLKCANHFRVL
jgi:hypothetical protein